MAVLNFALLQERKSPPDRRSVLSPIAMSRAQELFPKASFVVESSPIRVFPDVAYEKAEFEVKEDVSDADVMLGVKEVPIDALIPNKKYFFFSHTIKKQPYNRELLKAVLEKNIELYDHEVITRRSGLRLIGFGYYAGLVGTYNGFRAYGLRHKTFSLPPANTLIDVNALHAQLAKIELPPIKICLSGTGKVAAGAREILEKKGVKKVSVGEYLSKTFKVPVFCQLSVMDYNKRTDGEKGSLANFMKDSAHYESDFLRFAKVTQLFIAGHFYGDGAPYLFTREQAKLSDFNIEVVADISCDIDGPVASTLRASTIAEPFYGYDPQAEQEVAFDAPGAITVMAVDNLPCELPKDASEGFGEMFIDNVLPAFFNDDKDGILQRARMTKEGKLTPRFSYLQDYVDGKE
ncbi:NAD(P)-dependent oxidoreductase [Leeuwenhoekiella marinoflava]|uniref:Alanine dehydrogenase/PNT-like protein n=2 Tax=Leeuwenhoekiella marinoflava TaxID=988 RepID=A0A4Q0PLL0_9FLAO|nr:NAD(P)-dependent oxidoreductase [Leeuwenhoekiella marinoflava]RXG29935.1 alanine dehydrogenase/PNT-like protein [Leeuwenhoekiella marinoflava]SHF25845.1 Alanine dehydrogenase/PNT, N-terminal domain [Leeuwenhoekiella marinoflava DSM 3653]